MTDAPLMQQGDAVAHREGATHVVSDHEPGDAEIARPNDELVHHRGGDGVETGSGFVI